MQARVDGAVRGRKLEVPQRCVSHHCADKIAYWYNEGMYKEGEDMLT